MQTTKPETSVTDLIKADKLSRFYKTSDRTVRVLENADFTISAGSFIALVGRSGTGKTTLLNLLGGLDRPSSGRISVNGIQLENMSDRDLSVFRNRTVGFVFQSYFLRPLRSALDNVMVPLLFGDTTVADARQRASKCLEDVGLGALMHSPVSQLSGGQKQRVAIARAVANQPRLLLADEPTGSLDTETSMEIFELLRTYNQQHKTTIVMITHDPLIERFHIPMYTIENGKFIPYHGSIS